VLDSFLGDWWVNARTIGYPDISASTGNSRQTTSILLVDETA
jgi:hypothetical protein